MRAGVFLEEIDQSTRGERTTGAYGVIAIDAPKGDLVKPKLVANPDQLLKSYTPNDKVQVGYDQAFWSALAFLNKSNKLWVLRIANDPGYSGAIIYSSTRNEFSGDTLTGTFSTDYSSDPNDLTIASVTNGASASAFLAQLQTGSPVQFDERADRVFTVDIVTDTFIIPNHGLSVDDMIVPTEVTTYPTTVPQIADATPYYVVDVIDNDKFKLSASVGGVAITISVAGTGDNTMQHSFVSSGLSLATTYYVIKPSSQTATTIQVSTTLAGATASPPTNVVDLTDDSQYPDIITPVNSSIVLEDTYTTAFAVDPELLTLSATTQLRNLIATGVQVEVAPGTGGALSGGLVADEPYFIHLPTPASPHLVNLAPTFDDAIAGTNLIQLTSDGTAPQNLVMRLRDPEIFQFLTDELFLLVNANPGVWGDRIRVGIEDYRHKEPDTFLIKVYLLPNLVDPVETWVCSRIEGKLDGNNRNVYLEDVLLKSQYIRAIDNLAIDNTVFPMLQSVSSPYVQPVALDGGHDGEVVTDSNYITAMERVFKNPDQYPTSIYMDGNRANTNYQPALHNIALNRKDSLVIDSFEPDLEESATYLQDLVDYKNELINALGNADSFGGIYTPHVSIYDKYNDRNIWVSPDGFVGGIVSEYYSTYKPPAGKTRGRLDVKDLFLRFEDGEMDYLFDNNINPIRMVEGEGVFVWGDKTLQNRPSALDSMNVRIMLTQVEPAIKKALENFVFEFNDSDTRSSATTLLNSYLETVQANRGLLEFEVICNDINNSDDDVDNNTMNVWVFLKPNKGIRYIPTKIVITRTNIEFSLAADLL